MSPSAFAPKLPNIPRPIKKLLRSPLVIMSAASLGVRIGKDAYRMRKGEIDAKEFRARTGGHLGSISGGLAGAAAGAAALSAIPGIGTVLGAFAGGMLGEDLGTRLGRRAASRVEEVFGLEGEPAVAGAAEGSQPAGSGDAADGARAPKRNI